MVTLLVKHIAKNSYEIFIAKSERFLGLYHDHSYIWRKLTRLSGYPGFQPPNSLTHPSLAGGCLVFKQLNLQFAFHTHLHIGILKNPEHL